MFSAKPRYLRVTHLLCGGVSNDGSGAKSFGSKQAESAARSMWPLVLINLCYNWGCGGWGWGGYVRPACVCVWDCHESSFPQIPTHTNFMYLLSRLTVAWVCVWSYLGYMICWHVIIQGLIDCAWQWYVHGSICPGLPGRVQFGLRRGSSTSGQACCSSRRRNTLWNVVLIARRLCGV